MKVHVARESDADNRISPFFSIASSSIIISIRYDKAKLLDFSVQGLCRYIILFQRMANIHAQGT